MTQNEQILDYLKKHKGITSIEAINNFGITRLSARIADLRRDGHIRGGIGNVQEDGRKENNVRSVFPSGGKVMADSFVFYKSFWDGIKALPDDSALRLFRAACAYGIDGETPDLDGLELAVFTSWKANIDSAQKKRRDGEKGGRPKKTSGFESENQWLSDEKPVVSDSKPMVSESKPKVSKSKSNENENDNGNEDVNGKGKGRFTPPTLEEVKAYCEERKSPVDPVRFYEYFQTGGWKDSKGNPVRNWKQKLITWEKHSETPKKQNQFLQFEQHEYDFDALEKELLQN